MMTRMTGELRIILHLTSGSFLRSRSEILCLSLVLSFVNFTQAQSALFKSITEQHQPDAELYFTASTLRMINLERNSNFDEMVKDIRKMQFVTVPDFGRKKLQDLIKAFKDEESYEELIVLEGPDNTLYVLGKSHDQFVGLMDDKGDLMAVYLQGTIGIHKIPELVNTFNVDGFLNVFEFGSEERLEHARDRRNRNND